MANKEERNYDELPEADVLVDYIAERKSKGFYSLCFASGLPGTGKSSACIRLAELTTEKLGGPPITEKNVIDSLLGLVEFVKDADPKKVCIAVIEEVSVLFPSRRAMAGDNVAVGQILDTARKKQIILFANAPLWPSIDSHLRALGNLYLETLSIKRSVGVVISKTFRLQTNPGSGKTYFHHLKRNGREVHRIFTRMPSSETWARYEARKDKFMKTLYERLKFQSEKKNAKLAKEMGLLVQPIPKKELSPRELEVHSLYYGRKMRNKDISKLLGISSAHVSIILSKIKEKSIEKGVIPELLTNKSMVPQLN